VGGAAVAVERSAMLNKNQTKNRGASGAVPNPKAGHQTALKARASNMSPDHIGGSSLQPVYLGFRTALEDSTPREQLKEHSRSGSTTTKPHQYGLCLYKHLHRKVPDLKGGAAEKKSCSGFRKKSKSSTILTKNGAGAAKFKRKPLWELAQKR
jgi:hypothetical protein